MTLIENIFVPDPFDPRLAAFAAEQQIRRQPWIAVGPGWKYRPGACWPCFTERLRRNGWTTSGVQPAAFPGEPEPGWLLTPRPRRTHRVAPLPSCRRCQELDGFSTPEEWVSPLTGIVRSIEVAEVWPGYWIATAELSQSLYPELDGSWFQGRRQRVSGHGFSREQARRSCLYEAAERYSLQWHGDEKPLMASKKRLGERALPPSAYLLHSEVQYANREAWRRDHGSFQWVPEAFDDSAEIAWTKVRRLRGWAERWVPAEMCFLGLPGRFVYADTNGCAAGRTEDDAIQRALYELAERDAVALWWYNRARRPEVTIDHPARRIMERAGRRCWMLDLTHDLGIPVVVAISCSQQGGRIAFGSAAGATQEAAAARAAGEMLTTYDGLRRMSGDWPQASNHGALWRWFSQARVMDRPHLQPARQRRQPAIAGAERRLDGWVKRHTRTDLGVEVVRVIAPGLRHWWARFAPGRLYEVPPALGWSKRKLSEAELNPEPYLL